MLKKFRYSLADKVVNKVLSSSTINRIINVFAAQNIHLQLQKNALESTAKYVEENMIGAVSVSDLFALLKFALSQAKPDGMFLEFGVAGGNTINFIAKNVQKTVHGFDSFEGLPEFWIDNIGGRYEKGTFNMNGKLPSVRENVQLHVGWFDKTLPEFVASQNEYISFMHVDCDLYSSTKSIFDILGERVKPGTIIVFNEYFNYPGWQQHEFKAFQQFVADKNIKYDYIAYNKLGWEVAVKIL
ncbi:MAG: class I SAM-dependent methyltransferase [Fischerella sp.]|jgi:predicted O-methyltransferase YrrM|uniref:class I SAM-dependent methyltransferase n=1 Tax=unclassified Fischerella TaxID=494603 RepID=UPI0004B7A908|nr:MULTISPECIES: class I SAM-dependent methyltransferase [unclassified Fischerella]NWF58448.1 class I SAM-dependent methyltransferase [Fischerella sp.]